VTGTHLPGPPLAELLRRRFGTERSAAEALGINPASISRWARGERRPGFYTVDRLCVALGVHPAELYGEAWLEASADDHHVYRPGCCATCRAREAARGRRRTRHRQVTDAAA
jgi:transcriptional regulator with XRE-family HTH domain